MSFLLFVWEFPQIAMGFILRLLLGGRLIRRIGRVRFYEWRLSSGISLGWFCLVPGNASLPMLNHEYGHTRQSLVLGPLYLAVIGLPSFLWAVLYHFGFFRRYGYFSFYTEMWAEKAGENRLKR